MSVTSSSTGDTSSQPLFAPLEPHSCASFLHIQVDALVRGIKKHGGRVILSSHVDQVVMEGGRAAGVKLRPRPGSRTAGAAGAAVGEEVVRARLGVVSNASVWDTQKLLPSGSAPEEWRKRSNETPQVCYMGSCDYVRVGG